MRSDRQNSLCIQGYVMTLLGPVPTSLHPDLSLNGIFSGQLSGCFWASEAHAQKLTLRHGQSSKGPEKYGCESPKLQKRRVRGRCVGLGVCRPIHLCVCVEHVCTHSKPCS